ncbi:MAG TPA: OsmC family protein [Solirubrobacterales bacterium]|jgi:putative redox protein|nr:OsmC family protein [Solirubrobacterales bacterium]
MPQAVARRREGYTHDVEIDGEHTLVVDEPGESGGANQGPSPTRVLAAALAACTAITVEMYAGRKGWELGDVEVVVDMAYDDKSTPNSFDVLLKVPESLDAEQQERLLAIAGKCPVHRALSSETEVAVKDRIEWQTPA